MSINNVQANKPKNKHILVQTAVCILILFGIFTAINCVSTYKNFSDMFLAKTQS